MPSTVRRWRPGVGSWGDATAMSASLTAAARWAGAAAITRVLDAGSSGPAPSAGSSGVRQQCCSHSAPATRASAPIMPIVAASVSPPAAAMSALRGAT